MLRITTTTPSMALLIGCCSIALAQDPPAVGTDILFQRVVPNDQLARQRGGADTRLLNFVDLDAALHHNSARANLSGNNAVSNGAFSNLSGLATVIQNSGNNVIIQNATILNLDLR